MDRTLTAVSAIWLTALLGCGGGDAEPVVEEAVPSDAEQIMQVPDSIIERDVIQRLEADPRLDVEGVAVEAHSVGGDVTVVGQVPTRQEMGIVRQTVLSVPGVHNVFLDSVEVLSEFSDEGE